MPWSTVVVGIVLGGVVLWAGWTVRQFKAGKRAALDPTRAMRTAMLAQACAYAGALLAGAYGDAVAPWLENWQELQRAIEHDDRSVFEYFRRQALAAEPFWLHSGKR